MLSCNRGPASLALSATIFKCQELSQIIDEITKPLACPRNKAFGKNNPDTNLRFELTAW